MSDSNKNTPPTTVTADDEADAARFTKGMSMSSLPTIEDQPAFFNTKEEEAGFEDLYSYGQQFQSHQKQQSFMARNKKLCLGLSVLVILGLGGAAFFFMKDTLLGDSEEAKSPDSNSSSNVASNATSNSPASTNITNNETITGGDTNSVTKKEANGEATLNENINDNADVTSDGSTPRNDVTSSDLIASSPKIFPTTKPSSNPSIFPSPEPTLLPSLVPSSRPTITATTTSPTNPPTLSMLEIVTPISGEEVLSDKKSPQYEALQWMLEQQQDGFEFDRTPPYDKIIQRYIIVLLYYMNGGKRWGTKLGFLSRDDECTWNNKKDHGVFCDDGSTVSHIWLQSLKLRGSIAIEIGYLKGLKALWLNQNILVGTIPTELGLLEKIDELYLYQNKLTGTIPTEIGNMKNLDWLWLSKNSLTGTFPAEIGKIKKLEYVAIHENDIGGNIQVICGKKVQIYADCAKFNPPCPKRCCKICFR